MSRVINVNRTPGAGRMPKRLSTWTWAWPPPTRTRSCAIGALCCIPSTMPERPVLRHFPLTRGSVPQTFSACRLLFLEVEAIGAGVAADPAGGRRREMRRQDQGAQRGVFLDQPGAADARALRVGAGDRRPFRLQALQRVVQNIPDEHATL